MDELVLNNRRIKLVDGEIYSLKQCKNPYWLKIKPTINENGYYTFELIYNNKRKRYKYHRVVYKFNNRDWDMTCSYDNDIDHIDNNRTNNNIENLRVLNRSENNQNSKKTKGYTWCKTRQKYKAKITINYKCINLGYYDTAEEARDAYLVGKIKYHTH
tara:strand:- start:43 stop:516 length:474 start_codon:yes stop_codon:yes gene_type:complete